jgi:2-polyprenyl-3-methyl-5-hydroxy-6-metoxy-1,4-benzoquinol methylase
MSEYNDYGFQSADCCCTNTYLKKKIVKLLDKNINKNILDVGCGNGWLADYLLMNGFNVYGIDASESGIAIANQKYPSRFFVQNIESDKLPEELEGIVFDTIISTEVVEHLYSPASFVTFLKQILKKNNNGEIIISTPYHGYLKNLMLALLNQFDSHFTALWEGGHIKFWSRTTITSLLINSGFKVNKFIGCGRIPFLWKSMLIQASI